MDLSRYKKQILFTKIGEEGQKKLLNSKVAVIGMGALGSRISELLVRAGIGTITLIDRDFVELDNLQRQTLYDEEDCRRMLPKVEAAKEKLKKINSEVTILGQITDLRYKNIEILQGHDLLLDGTDNFQTRFLINDFAIKNHIPWIFTGVLGSYGQVMPVVNGVTPCLFCLLGNLQDNFHSESCDTVGVLSTIIAAVVSFQVNCAIKYLVTGCFDQEMILFDIWETSFEKIKVKRNENCPVCVRGEFNYLSGKEYGSFMVLCGRNAVHIDPSSEKILNLNILENKFKNLYKTSVNEYMLRFFVENCEITIFKDSRVIIKGTSDMVKAKSLYERYIGG